MKMIDYNLLKGKITAMQSTEPEYAFNFLNNAQNPSTEWECIKDMLDSMEVYEAEPVNQWISVKDRLPEENTLVLCYARSTTGEGNDYFLGALAHGEFWFLKVNDIGHVSCPVLHWKVTHWQPLPEPPKDGDTND